MFVNTNNPNKTKNIVWIFSETIVGSNQKESLSEARFTAQECMYGLSREGSKSG